VETINHFWKNL